MDLWPLLMLLDNMVQPPPHIQNITKSPPPPPAVLAQPPFSTVLLREIS